MAPSSKELQAVQEGKVLSEFNETDPATLLPEQLMDTFKPLGLIVKNTFFDTLERPGSLEEFLKERLAISCPATRQNTLERGKSLATEQECLAEMSPCPSAAATSAGGSASSSSSPCDDEDATLNDMPSPRGSWCSTPRDMDEMCTLEEEECARANPIAASASVVLPGRYASSRREGHNGINATLVDQLHREVVAEVQTRMAVGQQVAAHHHPSLSSTAQPVNNNVALHGTMSLPPFSQMAPLREAPHFSAPLQPRASVQQPLTSMDTPMMLSQPQQAMDTPLLLSTAPQPSQPSYSSSYHPSPCGTERDGSEVPLLLPGSAVRPRESICLEAACELQPVCQAEQCTEEPPPPVITTNPGSLLHDGTCKSCTPCMFVHEGGCRAGIDCQYCHKCPPGEQKRRKVAKLHEQKRRRRQERHARKLAAREAPALPDENGQADEEDEEEEDTTADIA